MDNDQQTKENTAAMRRHLDMVRDRREEIMDPASEKLNDYFDENDALHDNSKLVLQQGLITKAFYELSYAALMQSSQLRTSIHDYSVAQLITCLQKWGRENRREGSMQEIESEIVSDHFDFELFGAKIGPKYKIAPRLDFMHGLREFRRKERIVRQRQSRRKDPEGQTTKPVEVGQHDTDGRTETDRQISSVTMALKKRARVDLFEFSLDPDSYGKSVENLFYISFLIKDGRARIRESDGSKEIEYTKQDPDIDEKTSSQQGKQVILRLDKNRWQSTLKRSNFHSQLAEPLQTPPVSRRKRSQSSSFIDLT
mmetsp:Transcript_6989/g.21281  ORF Transcript_6989/g.21281 Transcript_6989/m.21281 type:complete len:311 (-) Transcript_6989:29-961(-)